MEKYFIEGSSKMPTVTIDPYKGLFEITGNSIPENAGDFYKPVLDALNEYYINPQNKTEAKIFMTYFNSASQKWLFNILKSFYTLTEKGFEVIINWYYDKSDESMLETIEDFKSMLDITINIIARKK